MQKIKYPVGSILRNHSKEIKIKKLSRNKVLCYVYKERTIYRQEDLDNLGYIATFIPLWKPTVDDVYWYIGNQGEINEMEWVGDKSDLFRLKNNNVFKTHKECQKKIDEINAREI